MAEWHAILETIASGFEKYVQDWPEARLSNDFKKAQEMFIEYFGHLWD
jgi:uncharacterized caspase-like protein